MDFHDKVAIVTGAGGLGCGRVMARRLAREGCRVVVSDRDEVGARETVRLIEADGGQAVSNRCDIGIDTDLSRLFGLALDHFGGVDILINNAGPGPHAGPLEGWVETVEATLVGTMRATLLAIDAMQRRWYPWIRPGRIVSASRERPAVIFDDEGRYLKLMLQRVIVHAGLGLRY